jgi:hypothetical protein
VKLDFNEAISSFTVVVFIFSSIGNGQGADTTAAPIAETAQALDFAARERVMARPVSSSPTN